MYINKILHTQALLTQKTLKTNAKSMLVTCKLYVSNYFFLLQLSLDFDVAFCVVSVFFFRANMALAPKAQSMHVRIFSDNILQHKVYKMRMQPSYEPA
jgi:hypothetical protein